MIWSSSNRFAKLSVDYAWIKGQKVKDKEKGKVKGKEKDKSISIGRNSSSIIETSASAGQGAKGVYVESLDDPMPGTWKFVVESDNAVGELKVKIEVE